MTEVEINITQQPVNVTIEVLEAAASGGGGDGVSVDESIAYALIFG
jgi:hypothetical protein